MRLMEALLEELSVFRLDYFSSSANGYCRIIFRGCGMTDALILSRSGIWAGFYVQYGVIARVISYKNIFRTAPDFPRYKAVLKNEVGIESLAAGFEPSPRDLNIPHPGNPEVLLETRFAARTDKAGVRSPEPAQACGRNAVGRSGEYDLERRAWADTPVGVQHSSEYPSGDRSLDAGNLDAQPFDLQHLSEMRVGAAPPSFFGRRDPVSSGQRAACQDGPRHESRHILPKAFDTAFGIRQIWQIPFCTIGREGPVRAL